MWGLRLAAEPPPNVQALEGFKAGRFEIQDEGSQMVCWLSGGGLDLSGAVVVDYCAGGGGKTLGLAQQGVGTLIAADISMKRLDAIRPRLERAGVDAELRLLGADGEGVEDLVGGADLVLVDAPCSGSGTWRRRPEDAWRLKADEVERLHKLQLAILGRAAALVKPGGRLVYVTCSMLTGENEKTADAFEAAHQDFRPVAVGDALGNPAFSDAAREHLARFAKGHRLRLSPATSGTDGFFAALYERAG
ncbi:RsmB/NOP family class I SAM-dependent RNA methyltransferase [Brevundimonas abyssalis]|uniref:RsmB/NOP family class I SAM-dependent RNA methyltransferase n=1 Tax=Brevundimonas abyssalis TaxID=1125965 RepID=UPI0003FE204E|nr:RsmB/NOP family class I SAM-dependent RNA methyltransferase [Brevundimonas abyssalis]